MAIRVGINGFGRIGRLAARVLLQRDDVDLIAINAPDKTPEMVIYAFTHDTVHGRWNGEVTAEGDVLHFGKDSVKLLDNRDPSKLGWGELGCDYVFECTGKFLSAEAVQPHLDAGAKFVLMSAPAKDNTPMFVYGVNHDKFDPALKTASAASCTSAFISAITSSISFCNVSLTLIPNSLKYGGYFAFNFSATLSSNSELTLLSLRLSR